MTKVRFYGVICNAKLTEDSFELIGKNKVSQKLLDYYSNLVIRVKNFNNFVLSVFGIESNLDFKLEVLDENN